MGINVAFGLSIIIWFYLKLNFRLGFYLLRDGLVQKRIG